MRWKGNAACMESLEMNIIFLFAVLKERNYSDDLVIDGNMILKLVIRNRVWRV